MKLIYIVGIILILTFPSISSGYSYQPLVSQPVQAHDYNFTRLQAGSFPGNESWIGFNLINSTASSSVGIEKAAYGNGLTVSTLDYSGSTDSYLNLRVRSNQSFNFKITFSWNYNNSLFYTGDQVLLKDNSSNLMQYTFGPDYGNKLHFSGKKNYSLSTQPNPFTQYTLDITGNESSNRIYTNIVQGWNETMHFPYIMFSSEKYSGSVLNLTFGGGYSNITIYNLYLSSESSGFQTLPSKESGVYQIRNISLPSRIEMSENSSMLPVVDWMDNSILYLSNNPETTLESYNFYNSSLSTLWTFYGNPDELVSAGDNGTAFFLLANSTQYSIAVVNFTTGKISNVPVTGTFSDKAHLLPSGASVYVINNTGTVAFVSNVGGKYSEKWIDPHYGGLLLAGSVSGSILSTELFNRTFSKITELLYSTNGSITKNFSYTATLFGSISKYRSDYSSNPSTVIEINSTFDFPGTILFVGNPAIPYVIDNNISYMPSSGPHLAFKDMGNVYLFSKRGLTKTDIPTNSTFISFDNNLSLGMSLNNRSLSLYYQDSNPFSGKNISISLQPLSVIGGNVSISYTVQSNLSYSIDARFGNLTLYPHSGFMNFSTDNMPSGNYVLAVSVSNIAGYYSSEAESVAVDNYLPTLILNPANNSLVLANSTIKVSILGLNGTVITKAKFSGINDSSYDGDNFSIVVPDLLGNITLTLTTTDQYGVSRVYDFFYQIVTVEKASLWTNILPNSYLRTGDFNLSWTPVPYSIGYNISLFSSASEYTYSGTNNYTAVNLLSGEYNLTVSATLENLSVLKVIQENFTVQDFKPLLRVNRSGGHYFSFYGDSENNSLSVDAYSNVSGIFWLNLTRNGITIISLSGKGTYFHGVLDRNYSNLKQNGNYTVNLTDREASGRENYTSFTISVNNTIPIAPVKEKTLYYNVSDPVIPLTMRRDISYSYVYGIDSNRSILSSSFPVIHLHNFTTKMTFYAESMWGNVNSSSVKVIFSAKNPRININMSKDTLIWNNTLRIEYSISDPVNITSLSLNYSNRTLSLIPESRGNVDIVLRRDGTYNFTLNAEDICGNINTSQISAITCDYYPHISSMVPATDMFMGVAYVSSHISGDYLQSVNLSWEINGKLVSRKPDFWITLLPGTYNITLTARYHGNSIVSNRSVFTFGFVPELISILAAIVYFTHRRYSGSSDAGTARKFILNNVGRRRSEVYSLSRAERINRRTVSAVMLQMISEGTIKLIPDPDGNLYVLKRK